VIDFDEAVNVTLGLPHVRHESGPRHGVRHRRQGGGERHEFHECSDRGAALDKRAGRAIVRFSMSSPAPEISPSSALPEGVREGNENLVKLTPSAGGKVAALIAREAQGEFSGSRSRAAGATG